MSKRLPPFSADYLLQALNSMPPASSYLVGFSGGADSTALLHAMATLKGRLNVPVRAVHVNHHLHEQANQWQQHCEQLAHSWGVPISSLSVNLENNGKGLEAEARELRYAAMQSIMTEGECLVTAHHADDQAETLLLNLFRGSGVDGLSAMPAIRPMGQHRLLRPLLDITGQSLREYLQANEISWLEDPSNASLDQDRNFVRNQVLPLLEERFEGMTQRLLQTRESMSESRSLLESLADDYLATQLSHPQVLNLNDTLLQSAALFKLVVRRWLGRFDLAAVPGRQLHDFYHQVSSVGTDHQTELFWSDVTIRVFQNQLFLHVSPDIHVCASYHWPDGESLLAMDQDLGQLSFSSSGSLRPPGDIKVINRQAASGQSLARAKHHQSLKNLFQSAHIPVWLRDSIPLTLIDDELVAVGDWSFSTSFALWLSENNVKFVWQPKDPILQFIAGQQHQADKT